MKAAVKKIFDPFKQDIDQFNDVFSDVMRSDIKLVDQVAKYIVKHKGKQFRPLLLIVSARAVGQPVYNTYVTAAVTELLHTATLLHDDVLDDAELRRGFKTIHKIWKNKIAIVMGDYLLAKSLISASETGNLDSIQIIANVAKRLIQGQIFEMQKSRDLDMTEEDYFRLVADKTASLISACCELGALTTGADLEQRRALRDFGEYLGIAFQIKDDLLDFESTSGIIGKPAMADLEDKKITLPIIYALQSAPDKERKQILKRIKKGIDREGGKLVLDFLHRYQGLEKAREKAEEMRDRAIKSISILPPTTARESLEELAHYVIDRNK